MFQKILINKLQINTALIVINQKVYNRKYILTYRMDLKTCLNKDYTFGLIWNRSNTTFMILKISKLYQTFYQRLNHSKRLITKSIFNKNNKTNNEKKHFF